MKIQSNQLNCRFNFLFLKSLVLLSTETRTSVSYLTIETVHLESPISTEVQIPSGDFMMGSTEEEIRYAVTECQTEMHEADACQEEWFSNELDSHEVHLKSYFIDRYEVNVAQYMQCVRAMHCQAPPYEIGGIRFRQHNYPVSMVTWSDAVSYCAWRKARLPTEAEWERAARGLSGRKYTWGNVYNKYLSNHGQTGWISVDAIDGFNELAPITAFSEGRTENGIYNLLGNVEEWVSDYYAPEYPEASVVNPKGPTIGEQRVIRGGSYMRARPWIRNTARNFDFPETRHPWRGFRCARDV